MTKGVPVLEHEPGSALAGSFRQLAASMAGTPVVSNVASIVAENGDPRKRRLFRLGRV
jgi:hypothetical protein